MSLTLDSPLVGDAKRTGVAIAPGVVWLHLSTANAYLVGEPGESWAIVDTGVPNSFEKIRALTATYFGANSRPEAIYLTHGHLDHAGSALALAAYWDVPVFVHKMEMPYLTGRADYPPLDPTVGGALATLARFLWVKQANLGEFVRPLPATGTLPGLKGWNVIETPGHSPGHVAFFRQEDGILLAGDACQTMNSDSWRGILNRHRVLMPPPSPSTIDWVAVRRSLRTLAVLRPRTLACGHGNPMSASGVADQLENLAEMAMFPLEGRYISDPARWDENGITFLPPQWHDALLDKATFLGAATLLTSAVVFIHHKGAKDRQWQH